MAASLSPLTGREVAAAITGLLEATDLRLQKAARHLNASGYWQEFEAALPVDKKLDILDRIAPYRKNG